MQTQQKAQPPYGAMSDYDGTSELSSTGARGPGL